MNELTIHLKTKSKIPLYEQIYEYIKSDIQNGRIHCKEKLPSTRTLARYLEVSRSTIELAYEQLLAEGYVEAEPCRGYFVTQIEELYQWKKTGRRSEKKIKKEKPEYQYDFSPRGIDLDSFPYNVWRKLSKEVLGENQMELFQAGDAQGEYEFRETICSYLYQSRGVNCDPDQIIVGAGNESLLMLLGMMFGGRLKIAFENPTYTKAYHLFENLAFDICTVNMDQKGMRVDELEKVNANIAYVMPSHQYPLGIVMPVKRRMELLKWADQKEDRYVIEDDYDSEFRYKGKPIPSLQGYDANGKVIYIGTFSRSIAPAIRISYMVLPKKLLRIYKEKCRFLNSTVPRVDQLIVRNFIHNGYYERHLNKMRAIYKGRHDKMVSCLKPLLSYCKMSGEHAGVHLLLTFQEGISERELLESASCAGVRVYGLSGCDIEEEDKGLATILLGYANMKEDKIKEAADLLKEAWLPLLKESYTERI